MTLSKVSLNLQAILLIPISCLTDVIIFPMIRRAVIDLPWSQRSSVESSPCATSRYPFVQSSSSLSCPRRELPVVHPIRSSFDSRCFDVPCPWTRPHPGPHPATFLTSPLQRIRVVSWLKQAVFGRNHPRLKHALDIIQLLELRNITFFEMGTVL